MDAVSHEYPAFGIAVVGAGALVVGVKKLCFNESHGHQKKLGLALLAGGVAAIAFGASSIYESYMSNVVLPQSVYKEALNTINEAKAVADEETELASVLVKHMHSGDPSSVRTKIVQIFEACGRKLSSDNYIPCKSEFNGFTGYIDGVRPADLPQSLGWSIDQWNRPFLAFKYLCNNTFEGAAALFQRYETNEYTMALGGHHQASQPLCNFLPFQLESTLEAVRTMCTRGYHIIPYFRGNWNVTLSD